MRNTIRIILSLRNTITVNGLLYGIKHIPLIGKHISDRIYGIRLIKILALIVAVIVEVFKAFFGKALLFGLIFLGSVIVSSFNDYSQNTIYMYALLMFLIAGAFMYNLFNVTTEVKYAVFLLGMDAKKYITSIFAYDAFTIFIGYAVFGIPTAIIAGVPWYFAVLIPFAGVGTKAATVGLQMSSYAAKLNSGRKTNRRGQPLTVVGSTGFNVLLCGIICTVGAIAAPMVIFNDMFLMSAVAIAIAAIAIIPGILAMKKFPYGMYRTALFAERNKANKVKQDAGSQVKKMASAQITETEGVTSGAKGFKYLNELFVKRHRKLLWGSVIKIIIGTFIAIVILSVFLYIELYVSARKDPDFDPAESIVRGIFTAHLSGFPFVLYFINRGAAICQTMFANCDSSLLTFGFYKTPHSILTMFRLRLISLIKLNFIPALMIAVYAVVVIALTGGQEYQYQYVMTFLSIILSMVFFSVHHLAIYYLLQPYTSEYKIKSKSYQIVSIVTYMVCWFLFNNNVSATIFAPAAAVFTVVYAVLACVLVYKFAPKTFRIK